MFKDYGEPYKCPGRRHGKHRMTRFFKRQWPLIGLGILLALVGFYFVEAGRGKIQNSIIEEVTSGQGLKLNDIHLTQDDLEDKIKWVLDAKEVKISKDRSTLLFRDFLLKLEPEDRPFVRLKGNRGNYDRNSGVVNLWGELEAHSENGYRLFTEHLRFDEKKSFLRTDDPVEIIGPFFSIKGQGLALDLKKESMKILSDVTTIMERETFI